MFKADVTAGVSTVKSTREKKQKRQRQQQQKEKNELGGGRRSHNASVVAIVHPIIKLVGFKALIIRHRGDSSESQNCIYFHCFCFSLLMLFLFFFF